MTLGKEPFLKILVNTEKTQTPDTKEQGDFPRLRSQEIKVEVNLKRGVWTDTTVLQPLDCGSQPSSKLKQAGKLFKYTDAQGTLPSVQFNVKEPRNQYF